MSSPAIRAIPTTVRVAAVRRSLRPLERVWAVVLLSVISGAYLPFLGRQLGGMDNEAGATALAHLVLLPLYAGLGMLIVTHPREFVRAMWRGRLALALVLLAALSTIWSMLPGLTFTRSISLMAPTAAGLMLSARFPPRELLRLLAFALGIPAILSVLVVLALPADGIMSIEYGDAWRGVYFNKNSLGRAMALGMGVFVLLAYERGRHRWLVWLAAAACLGLVVMARAAASLIVCAALACLIPLFRSLRLRTTTTAAIWTIGILVAAIAGTLALANAESTFALVGRDATLTGRTDIWAAVAVSIAERPWLGHGYNAFWQDWNGPSAAVLNAVGWETPHSHNGFLDLALDLGLVSTLLFLWGFVAAAWSGMVRASRTAEPAELWPLVFLGFLMLINVSEAVVLKQHNLFWVLYVAVLSSPQLAQVRSRRPGEATTERWESPDGLRVDPIRVGRGQVSPGVRASHLRRSRHG